MNKSKFVQTEGYPLTAERLQELQSSFQIFNAFASLAGNLTIITGCETIGNTVQKGTVIINGELLEFREAVISEGSTVIIYEEDVSKPFKNGTVKDVYTIRYASIGTSETSWLWSSFVRIDTLKNIQSRILPPGTNPQLYCGSVTDIPSGWYLCDGENDTPDLKGKFIVAFDPDDPDYNVIGKPGGFKKTTPSGSISNSNISITIPRDGWGVSGGSLGSVASGRLVVGSGNNENAETLESLRSSANNVQVNSNHGHSFAGNEQDNRPVFYTLAYIIYKG